MTSAGGFEHIWQIGANERKFIDDSAGGFPEQLSTNWFEDRSGRKATFGHIKRLTKMPSFG
ncbi:MAG: hypothetical protein QNJ14_16300 [Woeseiaceae bacterium]|nr:hypothetical protein [Woeseiaceae bacterium]